jgi:hypothetical protein
VAYIDRDKLKEIAKVFLKANETRQAVSKIEARIDEMEEGKLSMTTLEECNLELQILSISVSEEIEKLAEEARDLKHMNEYLEVQDILKTVRKTIMDLFTRIMQINSGVRTKKQVDFKP